MARNKAKDLLPIKTKRCLIDIIKKEDLEWYMKQLGEDYFNEYLDNKATPTGLVRARKYLESLIEDYSREIGTDKEIRLVVKINETPIGGITLDEYGEIAYWTIPSFQGKGITYEALVGVIKRIRTIEQYSTLKAVIQYNNYKSIGLVERLGFKLQGRVKGNLVYSY